MQLQKLLLHTGCSLLSQQYYVLIIFAPMDFSQPTTPQTKPWPIERWFKPIEKETSRYNHNG